ncbi:MAG: CoA-binding protein [Candidatus Zixiibacteriota bacterium]
MTSTEEYSNPPDEQIREILQKYTKVAVVGLSPDPSRPSNGVARYLKSRGYKIFPVNPGQKEILGERSFPDLRSIPEKVEIVDIFRRPEHVSPIVDEAIRIGAKVIWMQDGVVNDAAANFASKNGLVVVMNKCMLREHRKLHD